MVLKRTRRWNLPVIGIYKKQNLLPLLTILIGRKDSQSMIQRPDIDLRAKMFARSGYCCGRGEAFKSCSHAKLWPSCIACLKQRGGRFIVLAVFCSLAKLWPICMYNTTWGSY